MEFLTYFCDDYNDTVCVVCRVLQSQLGALVLNDRIKGVVI